jgi:hypothetical protein
MIAPFIATMTYYSDSSGFSLALTSSTTVAGALADKARPALLPGHAAQLVGLNDALDVSLPEIATWKLQSRSRRVIGHATHRPVSSLKGRGETTSAGRRPACWLAMAWRKKRAR